MEVEQLTYPQALEVLRAAYEHEKIQLTAQISTLQVANNQLEIKIHKQQEKIDTLERKIKKIPEPYPYTHPIRDMPISTRIKRSESNA